METASALAQELFWPHLDAGLLPDAEALRAHVSGGMAGAELDLKLVQGSLP